jgi:hypothetical protein
VEWLSWLGYTSRGLLGFHVSGACVETHGPFGTLWVGLGLGCFYIALIWLNTLLGFFLTPLFVIPATWLQDRLGTGRKRAPSEA